ncbi:hypothetical protein GCM10009549_33890 [Streptomyces thermoalcalitolerans]|uniref:Uncharacterized protein n=2 Tax=Streptomyces TaxID=1883 RepID=A0ABN1T0H7_9ACTN
MTAAPRKALRGSGHMVRLQGMPHLDEAAAVRMRPDFVLYGPNGAPRAVADAKHRAERRSGYPADLYRTPAYRTALGPDEGHLTYTKGNAPHAAHRVRHAGVLIHQHALDLDQEPAKAARRRPGGRTADEERLTRPGCASGATTAASTRRSGRRTRSPW